MVLNDIVDNSNYVRDEELNDNNLTTSGNFVKKAIKG